MASSTTPPELPGYALLIAAEPPARHPIAVTAVLPQLAAVPPAHLVGTPHASATQLANPTDPNTVLTHLRTAVAAQGPLLVYLAGHLYVDSRQHRLHLALAATTARTVRYTALPWHWLTAELRHRPPGATTVLADLAAGSDIWQALARDNLSLTGPYDLHGTVQLHDRQHRPRPVYSQALAQLLRATQYRPGPEDLHRRAAHAAHAVLKGENTLWLGHQPEHAKIPWQMTSPRQGRVLPPPPSQPPTIALPAILHERHQAVFAAAAVGRHSEAVAMAAAWEQEASHAHGPESAETVHWIEVQAELEKQAGDATRASGLWMKSAVIRLTAGQDETDPDVAAAVDRAHHCWHHVTDPTAAITLGIQLSSLRTKVTGKSGAREDIQQRLAKLSEGTKP